MSVDIKITSDNLMYFVDGVLQTVESLEAIQQGLRTKLQHFRGEYFLDKFYGLDFFNVVTNKKVSKESVDGHIKRQITSYPGVLGIQNYTSTLNKSTRHLEISVNVLCKDGNFQFIVGLA